jgi:Fic family protein
VVDEGYEPFPDIAAWTAVPFDGTTYEKYAALLEQARADAPEDAREHAVKTAIRYAGTDTGAIEGLYTTDRGFTRTVAIEAAAWEAAANERGPNAAQVIKDQIAAYEWVLDLVTQERPVTEHVVRELHAMLCRSQDEYVVHTDLGEQRRPLPKGTYKEFPNNPTSLATGRLHYYAPPDAVAPEMHRLVESLSSAEYQAAHPVVQAAYLHYSLAAIHPFADGNGRVARALASVPLYRALRVPLIVFRDQRDDYLDALERTDAGNISAFASFVAERVIDAVDLVRTTVRLGRAADRERSLAALRTASLGITGLSVDEQDAAASRIRDALRDLLAEQIDTLGLPPGIVVKVSHEFLSDPAPDGYRSETRLGSVLRYGAYDAPIQTWVATTSDDSAFIVTSPFRECGRLDLSPRDVVPQLREVARTRLAHWVDCVVNSALVRLAS